MSHTNTKLHKLHTDKHMYLSMFAFSWTAAKCHTLLRVTFTLKGKNHHHKTNWYSSTWASCCFLHWLQAESPAVYSPAGLPHLKSHIHVPRNWWKTALRDMLLRRFLASAIVSSSDWFFLSCHFYTTSTAAVSLALLSHSERGSDLCEICITLCQVSNWSSENWLNSKMLICQVINTHTHTQCVTWWIGGWKRRKRLNQYCKHWCEQHFCTLSLFCHRKSVNTRGFCFLDVDSLLSCSVGCCQPPSRSLRSHPKLHRAALPGALMGLWVISCHQHN